MNIRNNKYCLLFIVPAILFLVSGILLSYEYSKLSKLNPPELVEKYFRVLETSDSLEGLKAVSGYLVAKGVSYHKNVTISVLILSLATFGWAGYFLVLYLHFKNQPND